MKTRIISGVVMGIILAIVLALGFLWQPVIITAAIAIISACAIYELLHNAAGIKSAFIWGGSALYSIILIFILDSKNGLANRILKLLNVGKDNSSVLFVALFFSVLYFIFAVFTVLKNHKNFGLGQIAALCGLPPAYTFAFSFLGVVINHSNGIYYLLLLLNFSSVCDIGAYFSGSFLGKHKLCPNLSPKKTVEGAVGGVVSSIIVTVIITVSFGKPMLLPLIMTVPLCILGMAGDLFASAIKRSVGLKDYSNLIPGHGGILDRVDSILMIVPLMYLMVTVGII